MISPASSWKPVFRYDSINYGLWYDDAQFARVAIKRAEADRILTGDLNIPRESSMTLLREIVRKICPRFREMEPHGVDNYYCGGGSGFAIMSGHSFADCTDASIPKYVCAPCGNCKGM